MQTPRQSDKYVKEAYDLLTKHLEEKHAEVRLSAFQICDEIFRRSHCFRDQLILNLETVVKLTAGKDLPPPVHVAQQLKRFALTTIHEWNTIYGKQYKKLAIGFNYLRQVEKIDFTALNLLDTATSAKQQELKRRQEAINRERIKKVYLTHSVRLARQRDPRVMALERGFAGGLLRIALCIGSVCGSASRGSRLVRYSSWLVVRVGLGTWFVRVSPPPYGVHPRPLVFITFSFRVFTVILVYTMDHSISGPSGNASEATRIELQPENLDYVDIDDPVQRAVDDMSDEESDDGSSVNDADEDPDIYTTAPQWTITISGMRPIQFTKFEHNDEMRSRLTLLSAFGSAACAREYMSDNARCCEVCRRLMTLMGQNAHQEFGFVALMPFPDISTHNV
ncbi:hypothetical protein J6590_051037 [Homalodisca vitripennis]|nr:hypothetical protein J6590_051037 [Homalodisca vitripennis]